MQNSMSLKYKPVSETHARRYSKPQPPNPQPQTLNPTPRDPAETPVDRLRIREDSRGEKILYSGTDPESYITEYTLVYEDCMAPSMAPVPCSAGRAPDTTNPPVEAAADAPRGNNANLRILVFLVIYDSGYVSLEHLLLLWFPSESSSTCLKDFGLRAKARSGGLGCRVYGLGLGVHG